ncbi:hypothetical protein SYNTR_0358 [Candidatus Syntrophocurvum alkaliphilum]|uniref:Stage III sporulation protein AB n=1 Tax=Candidatus Syntrophocurvum alkaliphilum TaxID=2293317 RepID=A0A6I6DEM9_9FIRM|nr:hypothetical protein [Candidatus Syntrophocurvum alkaliphilum]QGT98951.1 hypothetical protein SYNTR_0358 [Candidatus Syntrophocurvum alkaliphilum]
MFLIKTIGIALVIGGCGVFGLLGAKKIQNRVEEIKSLRLAIGFLEKEISYMHTPLSRALERTANFSPFPVNGLFKESSKALSNKEGVTAAEAWEKGLEKLYKNSDLKPEDIELLRSIALQIGMSDAFEQRKFFNLIQEELVIQEEKARAEVNSGQKLWTYGGFILGAMIVLLLI